MRDHVKIIAFVSALALVTGCSGPDTVLDEVPTSDAVVEVPTLPPVAADVVAASGIVEFEADGLEVILKPTPGKPVIAVEMMIKGGAANTDASRAGLEELSLTVATSGGTKTTDKDALAAKLNSMGSAVVSSTSRDFSSVSMHAIRPYFDETWKLYAEVLSEPAFDAQQFDLEKTRALDRLNSLKDDPDQYVTWIANELHFAGHPYANRSMGNLAAVTAIDRDKAATYYRELLTRDRLVLVVVGDVTREDIEAKIARDLAKLPKGAYVPPVFAGSVTAPSKVSYDPREQLPTNYLLGFFNAPPPSHPDYYPMVVAINLLSDRLFEEVRTKRNLTYAVSAGLARAQANYGYLYTTAADPTTTIKVIYGEVDRLASQPLTPKEFQDLINVFLTEHFMHLETNAAQAGSLGSSESIGGGWEQSLAFIENIKKVTPEQIMAVSGTYLKDVHWGYVGNKTSSDESLLTSK
jgi:predicted Zn-dependent peptidase